MKQTRQQQKENTRQHILDQSGQVFAMRGFAAPARELAGAAGVSEGSLFAHFGTREQLVTAVVEAFSQSLTRRLHAAMADDQGGLPGFLRTHLEVLAAHEALYARLVDEQSLLPRDAQVAFQCMQSGVSHHLDERLRRERGIADIPLHMVFNTWMGLVHYYLANRHMFGGDAVLERHKAVLTDSFIKMITTDKGEKT